MKYISNYFLYSVLIISTTFSYSKVSSLSTGLSFGHFDLRAEKNDEESIGPIEFINRIINSEGKSGKILNSETSIKSRVFVFGTSSKIVRRYNKSFLEVDVVAVSSGSQSSDSGIQINDNIYETCNTVWSISLNCGAILNKTGATLGCKYCFRAKNYKYFNPDKVTYYYPSYSTWSVFVGWIISVLDNRLMLHLKIGKDFGPRSIRYTRSNNNMSWQFPSAISVSKNKDVSFEAKFFIKMVETNDFGLFIDINLSSTVSKKYTNEDDKASFSLKMNEILWLGSVGIVYDF
ncbi:MAG: hypothetical protein KAH32_04045 [Chlamydiia bacterium]|nr:hypothetical protein [Chlamydiia bacterium]